MTRGTLGKQGAEIAARTPFGRIGRPEDLKGLAVLLLLSAASDWITGQVIATDGGMTPL